MFVVAAAVGGGVKTRFPGGKISFKAKSENYYQEAIKMASIIRRQCVVT